jgi:hypothetical protein
MRAKAIAWGQAHSCANQHARHRQASEREEGFSGCHKETQTIAPSFTALVVCLVPSLSTTTKSTVSCALAIYSTNKTTHGITHRECTAGIGGRLQRSFERTGSRRGREEVLCSPAQKLQTMFGNDRKARADFSARQTAKPDTAKDTRRREPLTVPPLSVISTPSSTGSGGGSP